MDKEKLLGIVKDWGICIVIALVIVSLVKSFVGFPTVVSGPSMDTTLLDGQRLWVSKIGLEIEKKPHVTDIITFEAPPDNLITRVNVDGNYKANYGEDKKSGFSKFLSSFQFFGTKSYIKRVIGLPGDHIVIKDGHVYSNDKLLVETYLEPGTTTENTMGLYNDVWVPDGYVYVLGDNREVSKDSRVFGCIPISKIEGKAVFRFWPFNKMGGLYKKN